MIRAALCAITAGLALAAPCPAATGGVEILIGGTGTPTLSPQADTTIAAVLDTYFHHQTWYTDTTWLIDNTTTPETGAVDSYYVGAQDVINELAAHPGPAIIMGTSQGAAIMGIVEAALSGGLPTLLGAAPLTVPADINPDLIHYVALAPPEMPVHGGGEGFFLQPYWTWEGIITNAWYGTEQTRSVLSLPLATFPAGGAGSMLVLCGQFDPVCDSPATWNPVAEANSILGLLDVHLGYGVVAQTLSGAALLDTAIAQAQPLSVPGSADTFLLLPDAPINGSVMPLLDGASPLLAALAGPPLQVGVDEAYDDIYHTPTLLLSDPASVAALTADGLDHGGLLAPVDATNLADYLSVASAQGVADAAPMWLDLAAWL